MKEGSAITGIRIPGEDEREWWKPGKNGIWHRSEQAPSAGQPAGYGFTAFACHSYPLWVSSDDPEIIAQVVPMELEQIGATTADESESHRSTRTVDHDGARTLIQALMIPGDLEDANAAEARWQRFFPAACLYAFPRNRIVIWKELGRFVVAFTREGRLVHFHAFGKGAFSEDLVREIACIYGELYGRDAVDEVTALLAWCEEAATPEARVIVDRLLQLPVEKAERPPPDPTIAASIDAVPESVLAARRRRRKRTQFARAALLAVAALAAAAGIAAYGLIRAEKENEAMREKILTLGPAAETARQTQERWQALEEAISVKRHPVEIFHLVASQLPPKGIQITKFEITGNQIKLSGEASSVPNAISLKAKLENSRELADYEWRQPPPSISGRTAKFDATGIYRFSSADEG